MVSSLEAKVVILEMKLGSSSAHGEVSAGNLLNQVGACSKHCHPVSSQPKGMLSGKGCQPQLFYISNCKQHCANVDSFPFDLHLRCSGCASLMIRHIKKTRPGKKSSSLSTNHRKIGTGGLSAMEAIQPSAQHLWKQVEFHPRSLPRLGYDKGKSSWDIPPSPAGKVASAIKRVLHLTR